MIIMEEKKYNLTWQNYTDHLSSMMKGLMMNDDFSNVTLVTEDKKRIKSHQNILSAFSPVFRNMLEKETITSPIIFLKGILSSEVESILQFIYLGEATFYEERMNEFLEVARSLEIKTLCDADKDEADSEPPQNTLKNPAKSTDCVGQMKNEAPTGTRSEVSLQEEPMVNEPPPNTLTSPEKSTDCVGQMENEPSIKYPANSNDELFKYIREVVEGNSVYKCVICFKTYESKGGICHHMKASHSGVTNSCEYCDFKTSHKASLTRHIRSKHISNPKVKKNYCDHCDYFSIWEQDLNRHNRYMHKI